MKKLTFWSVLMLMVMALSTMVACGSDDDDNGASGADLVKEAVGTWMCTQSTDSQKGQSFDGLMVGKEVTIKADGTYTSTSSSFGYSGTYKISGNTITAKSNTGATFIVTVTINGSKMTWNGTASNGTTFSYVFQKEI